MASGDRRRSEGPGIIALRGVRVVIDRDLAKVYGVPTKRLNQQVSRNARRFPPDFMFTLTRAEKAEVVAKCNHLRDLRYSPGLPRAFTEHGAVMAAAVLNTESAIQASLFVVRAFVRMREAIVEQDGLLRRLRALERRCDARFRSVFEALRRLMEEPERPVRRIGFRPS